MDGTVCAIRFPCCSISFSSVEYFTVCWCGLGCWKGNSTSGGAFLGTCVLRTVSFVVCFVCVLVFLVSCSSSSGESFKGFLARPLTRQQDKENSSLESASPRKVPFSLMTVRSTGGGLLFSASVELIGTKGDRESDRRREGCQKRKPQWVINQSYFHQLFFCGGRAFSAPVKFWPETAHGFSVQLAWSIFWRYFCWQFAEQSFWAIFLLPICWRFAETILSFAEFCWILLNAKYFCLQILNPFYRRYFRWQFAESNFFAEVSANRYL